VTCCTGNKFRLGPETEKIVRFCKLFFMFFLNRENLHPVRVAQYRYNKPKVLGSNPGMKKWDRRASSDVHIFFHAWIFESLSIKHTHTHTHTYIFKRHSILIGGFFGTQPFYFLLPNRVINKHRIDVLPDVLPVRIKIMSHKTETKFYILDAIYS